MSLASVSTMARPAMVTEGQEAAQVLVTKNNEKNERSELEVGEQKTEM